MTIALPLLNEAIRFEENTVNVLVIENIPQLRKLILSFLDQLNGLGGEIVLAENDEILELSKTAVLITDPFSLELDSKRIISKIVQDACIAAEEYAEKLQSIILELNRLAGEMCSSFEYDVSFNELGSFDELVKLMGFHADTENMSFPESLLEYMKLHRKFFGKKLFVFYNLKACLSPEELILFYRSAMYEKLNMLLVEDIQRSSISCFEKTVIVDKDLCII